jgi:AraC family L-rhamnose operon transcriptional activator RhaR
MVRTLTKRDWFHPDGFPICVARREPQEPFGLHTHEFSELVLITGGTGRHVLGQDSWILSPGDVFVIAGTRPHAYSDLRDLCLINIFFDPEALPFDPLDLPALPGYHALFTLEPAWRRRHRFQSRMHLTPSELDVAMGLVAQLESELEDRSAGFGLLATAAFMQLIGYLSRCYGRSNNPDSRALLQIANAISYLETNYAEEIDIDKLAEIAAMPRRSFVRAFRSATGQSPIAYLIELRLSRAAALLRNGGDSVTDVAYRVGFSDSNYFSRQFRKAHGVSPRDYYRQHRLPLPGPRRSLLARRPSGV